MSLFEEPQQEGREQMEIRDTASFQESIQAGLLDEAAAWLETAKNDPKYDARWLDHRSRELMRALCDAKRLDEAEKYVDYAQTEEGRRGRQAKIDGLKRQSS